MSTLLGLVEWEDGTVHAVQTWAIKFLDTPIQMQEFEVAYYLGEVHGVTGLYSKYEVKKRSDGTPVNNCFVLRPDRDDAAIAAMLAYADATSDSQLAKELREWAEFEQRVRCKEDSQ